MKRLVRFTAPMVLAATVIAIGLLASSGGAAGSSSGFVVGHDVKHDTSLPLTQLAQQAGPVQPKAPTADAPLAIGHPSPQASDPVIQDKAPQPNMPGTILNFNGIPYPGVDCFCAPPDTNGEVGATQYVQDVNTGLQVFDKATGASLLGPVSLASLWSGFGGVCEFHGFGDPVVVYDQMADRWLVTQFAGDFPNTAIQDECVAVSTSGDATGSYFRYDFHVSEDFIDYPKFGVWPDAYYMALNIFAFPSFAFLGPQPVALDRAAMLAGQEATFITPGIVGAGSNEETFLPADLDGSTLPPEGAPNPYVEYPGGNSAFSYKVWHFHVDFTTPANSTFTLFGSVPAAPFAQIFRIPQPVGSFLDSLGDRLMFRAAYRNFGDHESLVSNYTVQAGSAQVAGVRWFELRDVTTGPLTKYQEGTFAPADTVSRWMGSAAMDKNGDLAVGYSTSNHTDVVPSIRYAGRLSTDPLGRLAQGEAILFPGLGDQADTFHRWGDYSDLTVDPVDDCTFWYTNEYYPAGLSAFNWRTRIGSFRFPSCS